MTIHVVTSGDTILTLAQRYGVNPDNLLADNGLNANDTLVVGPFRRKYILFKAEKQYRE